MNSVAATTTLAMATNAQGSAADGRRQTLSAASVPAVAKASATVAAGRYGPTTTLTQVSATTPPSTTGRSRSGCQAVAAAVISPTPMSSASAVWRGAPSASS